MPARKRRIFSLLMGFNRAFHERMRRSQSVDIKSMLRTGALFNIQLESPTMKELAERLAIRPPSATTLVKSMEASGLLKRIRDRKDRRSVRLQLTPKGKKALEKQLRELERHLAEMLERLTDREQDDFIRILEKIT